MDTVFLGLTAQASDYGEYDKLIKVITGEGVKRCIVKGVKKPAAKLKGAAMPFAFYEFSGTKKSNDSIIVIKGASQIEDLFALALDSSKHIAAALMAEGALYSFFDPCHDFFVFLLRRIKDVIFAPFSPFLSCIRFFQYIIHSSGYGFDYEEFFGVPNTIMQLLSVLNRLNKQGVLLGDIDENLLFELKSVSDTLIFSALKKIVSNFEQKFACTLNSKSLI